MTRIILLYDNCFIYYLFISIMILLSDIGSYTGIDIASNSVANHYALQSCNYVYNYLLVFTSDCAMFHHRLLYQHHPIFYTSIILSSIPTSS